MRKQSLNIQDAWSYATRCRHCGCREVYVVDKSHMSYRAFYRQVTEQLVRIGFCQGCEEKGVHDLVAICQEKYDGHEASSNGEQQDTARPTNVAPPALMS